MAAKQVIRPARPEECAALSELAMRSKAHWGYDAAFLAACRDELTVRPEDIEVRRVTVLEYEDKVLGHDGYNKLIGFYGIDGEPPGGELWWLFVEPSAIGTGAGRTLWNHATDCAARLGMTTLRIESDPGTEGFYLAMGAVRVGETPSLSIPGRVLPLLEYACVREMTDYERAIVERMLAADFPGAEAARIQAKNARVWSIDDDGCIEFTQTDGPRIETEHYILANGDGPTDAAGAPIEVMLSTKDGSLWMLEFIRYSGDPTVWPKPEEWTIWTVPFAYGDTSEPRPAP